MNETFISSLSGLCGVLVGGLMTFFITQYQVKKTLEKESFFRDEENILDILNLIDDIRDTAVCDNEDNDTALRDIFKNIKNRMLICFPKMFKKINNYFDLIQVYDISKKFYDIKGRKKKDWEKLGDMEELIDEDLFKIKIGVMKMFFEKYGLKDEGLDATDLEGIISKDVSKKEEIKK